MKRFFLLFLIFIPVYSYLSLPDYIIKDESINFYFDAYYLLSKETDAVVNSSYFTDWSYSCSIIEGSADLELIGGSITIQEYKLIPKEYGPLKIKCKATIKNEKGQIFEAETEKTSFVIDDPNKICNSDNLLIGINPDPVEIKYLEDLVPLVYKLLKENKEQKIGLPIEVSIDYSGILGKMENPVLNCKVNDEHFKILQDFESDENSFTSTINLFLVRNISSYFPSFSIDCDFEAYCNFYDNKDLSKNIKKDFTIIVDITPISNSSFILIYNASLNLFNSSFFNLTMDYTIRSALQQFEMKLSPLVAGIPGVLLDLFLNPGQVTISQLIAFFTPVEACPCTSGLSPIIRKECNPITGSGVTCMGAAISAISAASSCSVVPTCAAVAGKLGISVSYYTHIYATTAIMPLFFTTLFTIRPLKLTINTVCDPVQKWLYKTTANGYLLPVLNLYRYPPILPADFVNEVSSISLESYKKIVESEEDLLSSGFAPIEPKEYFSKVNTQIQEIQNAFNNNPFMTPYNEVKQAASKIAGPFRSAINKSKDIAMSILTNLVSEEFANKIKNMLTKQICAVENSKDNPTNRAGKILSEFFIIAQATGTPSFSSIARHYPFQVMLSLMELTANFMKSKEQCIFFNTFAPLSYLNKTFKAKGIRAELKDNFDIKFHLGIKEREYLMCPGEVSNAISKYLNVLASNQRCLYSALNWVHYKDIFPNFDGDLTKLLNEDLTRFLLSYSSTSFVEAKYSLLLTEYKSIKELAYCSNLRKYINCLEKEAVNECRKNKLKISALYLSKTASTIFSKYVARFTTNLLFGLLESKIPGLCGKINMLKGILKVATFALQFKSAIDNYKKAAKCFEEVRSINYSQINLNEVRQIRFDEKCKQEYEDSVRGLDCILKPDKCSLAGWLSFFSQIIDPNAVDNYIKMKLDEQIDKLIKKLIKKGAAKCQFEKDNFNYDIIFLDQILEIHEDINEKFSEVSRNLNTLTIISFEAVSKEKEFLRKTDLESCVQPDCDLIKTYYPLEEEGNFCIYKVTKKNYNLTFQSGFDKCKIVLVFEKAVSGGIDYNSEAIKEINNCQGLIKVSLDGNLLLNKIENWLNQGYNSRFLRGIYLEIWPYEGNNLKKENKASLILDYQKMKKDSYYVEKC